MLFQHESTYFRVPSTGLATSTKQHGATLVIALIILLVMSMIGIANMQSSTMQERMAANTRQKTLAKYAAESALREAENWLTANVVKISDLSQFIDTSNNALYSAIRITQSGAPKNISFDVTDAEAWNVVPGPANTVVKTDLVTQQPKYVIEYVGRSQDKSGRHVNQLNWEVAGQIRSNNEPYLFRITAIGWGKDINIYTVLESSYATGSEHFFNY